MTRENREIKFRAWNKETNTMHYDILRPIYWSFSFLNKDVFTWSQYVGKKDKNGISVYEKDYDSEGNMIDWCDECCGYQFFQIDIPTKDIICCHNCEGNFMLQDHMKDFEIVGNIYENNSA